QPLADGRSNILLQGLERYEIQAEHFERPYREATIRLCPRRSDDALDPSIRAKVVQALENFLKLRDDAVTWQALFRQDVCDDVLINTLSTYLECTPLEKQFLLEAENLQQQARRLGDLLQFMVHDRHEAKGWG
ncbi:MAG TPA: LON peptidase substrate-binding domain-containing protein, partial [Nitrospiraceae bacterium]